MDEKRSPGTSRDAKDKFREALERKRSHQEQHSGGGHGESKIHAERAAASTKRVFRRKSG
jgi:hypothetical protein